MPAAERTVGQAFARSLRATGLQRVYGLPGEDHLRLLDALEAEGLSYVAARDECAAAMMAATEAQATGRPGVVLVTIAPGLTNAVNGVAHAHLDGIPLLVVTGQHAPERAPLIVRQSLDNHRLVDSLTKWSAVASGRIHQVLARALDTAMAPPAGPVLLELRDDVAEAVALDRLEDWPLLQSTAHALRHSYEQPFAPEIVARIGTASRPAIVVGGGCPHKARIAGLGQGLRAPVFTSPSAIGMITKSEQWFAGTFMNGNLETQILAEADLIITVGLDAKDFFNAAWRYQAPIVAINERPDTQRFAPTTFQLVGDTTSIIQALVDCSSSSSSVWSDADVAAYRQHVDEPFRLADTDAFTIPAALRMARSILPPETLVAVDAGFGKPLTSYLWSMPAPNRYFTAHGLSTMGFAIPAANALQLTFPDHPVVAFMGDGSLLMRATEITVAAEHNLAPIYIAWMDRSLAQIETKQLRQDLHPVGAGLPEISCARVAEAFGATGFDVETLEAFRCALQAALTSRRPTLIGAKVDQTHRGEWYELLRG